MKMVGQAFVPVLFLCVLETNWLLSGVVNWQEVKMMILLEYSLNFCIFMPLEAILLLFLLFQIIILKSLC